MAKRFMYVSLVMLIGLLALTSCSRTPHVKPYEEESHLSGNPNDDSYSQEPCADYEEESCSLENQNGTSYAQVDPHEDKLHPFRDPTHIASLVMGHGTYMVIMEDGTLWAWVANDYGSTAPVWVMDNVKMASSNFDATIAVTKDNTLWAWGDSLGWLIRDGETRRSDVPVKVMEDVIFASLGDGHVGVIKSDNSLWTWGPPSWNDFMEPYFPSTPTLVLENVAYVSVGTHAMAITEDGALWGWGRNHEGEVGVGVGLVEGSVDGAWYVPSVSLPPQRIMENVVQVVAGNEFTGAITADGALWTWGNNQVGGVGDGTRTHRFSPVKIMEDVKYVSVHSAIKNDGTLWVWGPSVFPIQSLELYPVEIMGDVSMISSVGSILIKTNDGVLWVWDGDNLVPVERYI